MGAGMHASSQASSQASPPPFAFVGAIYATVYASVSTTILIIRSTAWPMLIASHLLLVLAAIWSTCAVTVHLCYTLAASLVERYQSVGERLAVDAEERVCRGWTAVAADGQLMELSGGRRVHYVLLGKASGHLILLLPAFPTFSRTWLPMAKQLAQSGFQVLTLDLLGTGFSDSPQLEGGAAATVEAYVDQAMELVDALGFMKPFTVVGYSTGAPVAMTIAAENPERVSRLILLSPAGVPASLVDINTWPSQLLVRALRSRYLSSLAYDVLRQIVIIGATYALPHALDTLDEKQQHLKQVLPQQLQLSKKLMELEQWLHATRIQCRTLAFQMLRVPLFKEQCLAFAREFPVYSGITADVWERVRNHPKKVAIIWAACDHVQPRRLQGVWKERLPQSVLYEVAGAGHALPLRHSQECARLVSAFLQQNMSHAQLHVLGGSGPGER